MGADTLQGLGGKAGDMSKSGNTKNKKEKLKVLASTSSERPSQNTKQKHDERQNKRRRSLCQGETQETPESHPVSLPGELRRIWLSKDRLKEWCFIPFFHQTLSGCFVRMKVQSTTTERNYLVAEIADVVQMRKVYQIGSTRTNLGLELRHGDVTQVCTLEFASNEEFTDREFLRWKEKLRVCGMKVPTLEHINKKQKAVMDALNHTFTEEQIERIIQEKNKFRTKPVNFAKRKIQLLNERTVAEQNRDTRKMNEIQEELEKIEADRQTTKAASSSRRDILYIPDSSDDPMNTSCRNARPTDCDMSARLLRTNDFQGVDPFTRRKTQPIMISGAKDLSVRLRAFAELERRYSSCSVE